MGMANEAVFAIGVAVALRTEFRCGAAGCGGR
jgi:hypothetical protein